MLYLSDDEIQYAILKCLHNERFRVIIACTRQKRSNVIDEVYMLLKNRPDCRIRHSMMEFEVFFENGSLLRVIPASENARGHRSHLLIVDDWIDRDIINDVLMPYETLNYREQMRFNMRQEHQNTQSFEREYLTVFQTDEDTKDIEYPEVSGADLFKVLGL